MSEAARAEAQALMQSMEAQPLHVTHVTSLALQIFDELSSLHGLGERERLLLEAAGYLHDIGHQFEHLGTGHHKESARVIREHGWKSFSPEEVSMFALVARYHRKAVPEMKDPFFAALYSNQRRTVQILAAILRIADALDRNHEQFVTGLRAEVRPSQIVFHLEASGPVLREVLTAQKKGDLAREMFQRELVFMLGDEVIPGASE
jgi:exopolyphosphatase/guanosine-5'-triphosphate,3'-diphosphate pyrophosphatase